MYNEYFGFKEAPFSIAPDPRYLYMTAQHREALAHLVYGLNSDGGCILLTGEVGTGKTTICRCLLEQIPDQANVALVLNPKLSEIELLETICDELNISYPDSATHTANSLKTYTDRIYEFLIRSNQNNEKTVLIIDEAQNLDSKVLEQLRLLTNLETNQRKLLQIIILGQPELLDILAKPEMRQLAQRITARFHLQPLTKTEVKAYVSHRLAVAGQNIQLFPENSIKLLYKLSNGIPRLINILCDRALLGAYVEAQHSVNSAIVKKAATEVFGELKNVERQHRNKQWIYPVAAVASMSVIAIIVFLYFAGSRVPDNAEHPAKNQIAAIDPAAGVATEAEISADDLTSNHISTDTDGTPPTTTGTTTEATKTQTSNTDDVTASPLIDNTTADNPASDNDNAAANESIANPEQGHDSIETILNTSSSQASAFQTLFKIWQQKYNNKSSATACKQAKSFHLSCLHKQGNLNSLKAHNRPAILKLVNAQGVIRYVTITSIRNKSATVYANNKAYNIKLNDLDQYWYGQFILLWQRPEHYSSAITPGDSGSIVSWLNTHFSESEHSKSDLTTNSSIITYDNKLINQVKDFQAKHGLTADGIVGPVTIIHLNTRSGENIPTLIQQS